MISSAKTEPPDHLRAEPGGMFRESSGLVPASNSYAVNDRWASPQARKREKVRP